MDIISSDPLVFSCGMSRSGTTLLTTILDSHSQVFMAYELLPPPLPDLSELLSFLKRGMELGGDDFSKCGKALKDNGFRQEGLFFVRCYRAGIDGEDIEAILKERLRSKKSVQTVEDRFEMAWAISKRNADKHSGKRYGFKINAPSFAQALHMFPQCRMIYILRDPRDVAASHIERKFDRTLEMVCKAWDNYRLAFQKALSAKPKNCLLIRYEDLVSEPEKILPLIMDRLSLELEPSLYRFYNSKAGVHSFGHPNADNLKKGFFTTSIQRWQKELSPDQIQEIEFRCKDGMIAHGYL